MYNFSLTGMLTVLSISLVVSVKTYELKKFGSLDTSVLIPETMRNAEFLKNPVNTLQLPSGIIRKRSHRDNLLTGIIEFTNWLKHNEPDEKHRKKLRKDHDRIGKWNYLVGSISDHCLACGKNLSCPPGQVNSNGKCVKTVRTEFHE